MRETVVFLPGLMCDARVFGPQIADLSADHAVMVAPVHGGDRAEEVASRLLDMLPARFALVGFDLGGAVALELARRAPQRVSRLALICAHPLPETPQQAAERDTRLIRARTGRLLEAVGEDFPPGAFADTPDRGAVLDLLADMASCLGPEVYQRQCRILQRRRDQQATLRRLAVPLLLLGGVADPLMAFKRLETMAEFCPGADLRCLDAAHFPTLEAAEEVCLALRDWLAAPLSRQAEAG